jgi:hypothetical protein
MLKQNLFKQFNLVTSKLKISMKWLIDYNVTITFVTQYFKYVETKPF